MRERDFSVRPGNLAKMTEVYLQRPKPTRDTRLSNGRAIDFWPASWAGVGRSQGAGFEGRVIGRAILPTVSQLRHAVGDCSPTRGDCLRSCRKKVLEVVS